MKENKKLLFKNTLLIILCLISLSCFPTAQVPQSYKGSVVAAPYVNKHIHIFSEKLNIKVSDFETAQFQIRYIFQSDTIGTLIPFLFDFSAVHDLSFKLDDNDILFIRGERYNSNMDTMPLLKDFHFPQYGDEGYVPLTYYTQYIDIQIDDTLPHVLVVSFSASADVSWWDYVTKSRFSYNQGRHLLWNKSAQIETTLVMENLEGCEVISNLPQESKVKDNEWYYEGAVPDNLLTFGYSPIISQSALNARSLVSSLVPSLIGLLCIGLHLYLIYRYRKSGMALLAAIVIAGSILVQFIILYGGIVGASMGAMIVGPYGVSDLRGDIFYFLILIFSIPVYLLFVSIITIIMVSISRRKKES